MPSNDGLPTKREADNALRNMKCAKCGREGPIRRVPGKPKWIKRCETCIEYSLGIRKREAKR